MRLVLAGLNHRTAPVQIRERFAFRPEEMPHALESLREKGFGEALILSTCNRVEIVSSVADRVPANAIYDALPEGARPHIYLYEGASAIKHLFRVASSLDSMIVGEPQILGQLKQAYSQARDCGSIGTTLEAVLSRAFHVAKRVRTETEIGQSAVSVSYAAVELAREIFGSLSRKKVLVIGAGKMSEAAVRHLVRAGASELLITNRTVERARELSQVFGGEVLPYEEFPHRLGEVDIVLASSAAPGFVLTRDLVRKAIDARRSQPMFFIDIAVPRNIDPEVNKLEHAFVYDIDDLQQLAARNMQMRREVADQAEAIIHEEVAKLEAKLRERDVAPTIASFQAQLEAIRKEVLERYRPRLGSLSPEQEETVEAITRGIINKVAHGPISEIRREAAEAQEAELVTVVRRMFKLGGVSER